MSDRDDFEKWAVSVGFHMGFLAANDVPKQYANGLIYANGLTQAAFESWQAARALLEAEVARLRPMEMCICESQSLVLRLNHPYTFIEMEGCESCKSMADAAREAYGPTGGAIDAAREAK